MPTLAEVNRTFPEAFEAFNNARATRQWKGDDYWDWLQKTIERNPNSEWAQYASFGRVPEGRADPVGDEKKEIASEKSYEQELFDRVNEEYIQPAIEGDAQRRTLADQLQRDALADYQTQRGLANQALGPTFNAETYFAANPDVAEAFAKQQAAPPTTTDGTTPAAPISAEEFARRHYETTGKAEGRQGAEYTSRLQREYTNADNTAAAISSSASTAATEQLTALEQEIASMQASLDVNQQAKAAALSQQIAQLKQNILDQDAAKSAAIGTYDTAQQAAIDAQDAARNAALAKEITDLTAAQLPVSRARVAAADNLVSSINLGLERTNDQLAARQAEQGFIGGSSAATGNLARAAIGARQQAAEAMGSANLANATDQRTIDTRGATEGRGISDQTSGNRFNLANTTARSRFDLANETSGNQFDVGNYGANTTYTDTLYGAGETRKLSDALAGGTAGIKSALSTQQQSARDAAAGAKSTYFDADYQRKLGTALTLPSLTTGLTNNLGSLDNYSTSGLDKALSTLNWWATGSTAPSAQTAQYQAYADQTGANIAGLGTGLLGAAVSIGNSRNWWQTPTTTRTGATTTPNTNVTNPSTNYNWSNVA